MIDDVWQHLSNQDIQGSERQAAKHKCWCDQMIFLKNISLFARGFHWFILLLYICWLTGYIDTHVEGEPDLFTEDDDEPVEPSEEEEDDHKPIRHDLVTSLHRPVVLLQLLGADVDVVFASIVRQPGQIKSSVKGRMCMVYGCEWWPVW